MKLRFFVFNIFVFAAFNLTMTQAAETRRYGAGIILGEPTGLSGKMFFKKDFAVDAGISYSFREYFHFFSDFLYHFDDVLPAMNISDDSQLRPFIGAGAGIRHSAKDSRNNKTHLFLRAPLGLEWTPQKPTIGLYLEVAPAVGIAPDSYPDFYAGLGIRYYF